jgi:type VI secretion system secreted protein Hcp
MAAAGTSPVDYFLKVDGIPGESTHVGHLKEFEIKDFSFGVENPTTIGSATSGAGAGKAKFNEFTITKTADKASPIFFKSCASGQHIKVAVLTCRKAGEERPDDFLKVTFSDILISSYSDAAEASRTSQPPTDVSFTNADVIAPPGQTSGPGDEVLDSISFNYAKIEMIEGRPQRIGVQPTAAGQLTFNSRTNDVTVGDWNGTTGTPVGTQHDALTDGLLIMRAVQEFDVKILIGLLTAPFSTARLRLLVNEVREAATPPGNTDLAAAGGDQEGPSPHMGPAPHLRFDVLLYRDADGAVDASDLTRSGKRIGQLRVDPSDPSGLASLDIDLGPILLKHDTDTFGIRLQLHGAGIPEPFESDADNEPDADEGPEERKAGRPDVSASFTMSLVFDTAT